MNFIKDKKYLFLFLLFGICIFAYPMFSSGFQKIPGDFGDTRFVCYNLEHYFLFLNRVEPHTFFWDMGIFYPMANNAAFSDMHIGLALIYIPVRFFIHNQFTVFQITFLFACILNFLSFYLLLNKCFKYNDLSSSIGGFIFAFSVTRYAQAVHLQLMGQFPMIFGLYFLCKMFTSEKMKDKYINAVLSAILFALQFWTAFYFSYFLVLICVIASGVVLFSKNYRSELLNAIKINKHPIIILLFFTLILSVPLLIKYYIYIPRVNPNFNLMVSLCFKAFWYSWFNSVSYIDNIILPFTKNTDAEMSLSCGFVTMIIGLLGIYSLKKYRKLIFIFISIIVIVFTIKPIFILCYKLIPAFGSIRSNARIVLILLPIIAIGLAEFIKKYSNKKIILFFIILLICVEQIPNISHSKFTKSQNNQRVEQYKLKPQCKILLLDYTEKTNGQYDIDYETDAMWVALKYKIKTFNGYSGYIPQRPFIPAEGICYVKAK